jgi:hypothetical protein
MSTRVGYGQKRILVTPEVIEAWLVHGNAIKTDLPDDARFLRLWQKDTGDGYMLVFESTEWEELAEGMEIPLITPEIEKVEE